MSTTFAEFLEEVDAQEKKRLTEEIRLDLNWKVSIRELYSQLERWVREADQKQILRVVKKEEPTSNAARFKDPRFNRPDLNFEIGSRNVTVTPAGRNVLGYYKIGDKPPRRAIGRLDMFNETDRYFLMLLENEGGEHDEWIILEARNDRVQPLTKECFIGVLQSLLS